MESLGVEPFTSNDTYACPDCGNEVRVGARSCPGCGPFRPMEWEETANAEPAGPFHSITTYTDTRDVLERSHHPVVVPQIVEKKPVRFLRIFLIVLIGLTMLSAIMAALKIFAVQ